MPNWCKNFITIKGDYKLIKKWILDTNFNFGKILPPPDILGSEDDEDYEENIPWCCNNWGCKWIASNCHGDSLSDLGDLLQEHGRGQHGLEFAFETPWAPPSGIVDKLCELGLNVKCYYLEEGMSLSGICGNQGMLDFDYKDKLHHWVKDNEFTPDDLERSVRMRWMMNSRRVYFSDLEIDFFDRFPNILDELGDYYADNFEWYECPDCENDVLEDNVNNHECAESENYCSCCYSRSQDRWDHIKKNRLVFAELEDAKFNPRNPLGKLEFDRRAKEDGIVFE